LSGGARRLPSGSAHGSRVEARFVSSRCELPFRSDRLGDKVLARFVRYEAEMPIRQIFAFLTTLTALVAVQYARASSRTPAHEKAQAEVNVLRVVPHSWKAGRMPGLIDPRTHLLVNNTEAVCRGRGKARPGKRYTRFVCVVRCTSATGRSLTAGSGFAGSPTGADRTLDYAAAEFRRARSTCCGGSGPVRVRRRSHWMMT